MVRLHSGLTVERRRFGKSATPNKEVSPKIVADDERKAYKGLFKCIARGMLAMASTFATTMTHAMGKCLKFSIEVGIVINVTIVVII